MRALVRALSVGAALALSAGGGLGKTRVASINMCTDQLLLALADPDQIVALSPFARNPDLSWYAHKAAGHRIVSGQAEDVLPLQPDLVFTATFVKSATREMLRRSGLSVVEFDSTNSTHEVKEQIREVGALIGQIERAEAAVAAIDEAIERARAVVSARPLRVLPLERRGWVTGQNSLLTEMLHRAGLRNIGSLAADATGGRLSLEAIVRLHPDRLLLTDDSAHAEDQGAAFLRHPALAGLMPADKRLVIPENMTVCGGPMLADAFDRLAREMERTGVTR